jgi:hypothetical protein
VSYKPLIKKEDGRWVVWFPVSIYDTAAIKNSYSTWEGALYAAGIWHWATATKITYRHSRRSRVKTAGTRANYINHIVLVLDGSSSMIGLTEEVIKVVDNQIAYLAEQSKTMGQETRITVYTFADTPTCIETIYDKDVLRTPSIKDYYKPYGNTALIDATTEALKDLAMTPEKYGDHAFLVYVVTDGEENASGRRSGTFSYGYNPGSSAHLVEDLHKRIKGLPDNWTVACLVPTATAMFNAKKYGFPAGNIAVWDATTEKGLREAGEVMRTATDSFMTSRTAGVRSTTNLFDIGANVVNAKAILDANLQPVPYNDYDLVPIPPLKGLVKPEDWDAKKRRKPWKAHGGRIDEFVQNVRGGQYIIGQAYYQLMEGVTVRVQASKNIAIVDKKTDRVYVGDGARKLLNLPDHEVRIKPSASDEYHVYVQSKAANRKLIVGSKLLIFKK